MKKINGRDLLVFLNTDGKWSAISCSLDCSLSMQQDTIEQISQDDFAWRHYIVGKRSWRVTSESLVVVGTADPMNMFGKEILLKMDVANEARQPSGSRFREGLARCVEIHENGRLGEMAKYKVTFVGIGELRYA